MRARPIVSVFMGSKLIPPDARNEIPGIGSDPLTPLGETTVYLRYYDSGSSWRWYVLEFDGHAGFFGLIVTDHATVAGQFTCNELSAIGGPDEDGVLLDPDFRPISVSELAQKEPTLEDLLAEPVPREQEPTGLVSLE